MGIFDKAKEAAENLAAEHGDTVTQGIDKVGDVVDEKTDGKYADKVDQGQDAAKNFVDGLGNKN